MRCVDLLFLESPEVIFKVAIALLDVHQEELLQRDGFEEIMDYLKNAVPKVDATSLEAIQKKVCQRIVGVMISTNRKIYLDRSSAWTFEGNSPNIRWNTMFCKRN